MIAPTSSGRNVRAEIMCRNIRPLFNFGAACHRGWFALARSNLLWQSKSLKEAIENKRSRIPCCS